MSWVQAHTARRCCQMAGTRYRGVCVCSCLLLFEFLSNLSFLARQVKRWTMQTSEDGGRLEESCSHLDAVVADQEGVVGHRQSDKAELGWVSPECDIRSLLINAREVHATLKMW